MINFLAHNDDTRNEMLDFISKSSIDDLFAQIPKQARMGELNLPDAMSEMQVQKEIKALAKKNNSDKISFLGAGVYNHFIPAAISQVASRYEFLTAYTPYQPEISQGTLQVMYEFQSMICNLTGMDVSNASVYDGGSACAEALLMASRITKKRKALVLNSLNPQYKKVVDTYTHANELVVDYCNLDEAKNLIKSGEYACLLVQNPDFYGNIKEINLGDLTETKTLLVVCADISSLAILKEPSEYGADIVVGDVQPLGIPMSYGGAHAGFMACREQYMRQLPGRITGKTLDTQGNEAYTLTLQTREQHIRREKATSNICSNQALIALCATLYLSLLGEKGFKQASVMSAQNAHLLAEKLSQNGVKVLSKDFYNEFVIQVENADAFLDNLDKKGIIGGLKLSDTEILVAATEMNTQEEIELYLSAC